MFSGQRYHKDNHMTEINSHKILKLLADNLPDMLWAKDVNGKYIFVNKAICNNLLMAKDTSEPVGKGDVFFAKRERKKHKENKDWHTFGELCLNSDEVVLKNMKNMIFEESGNVKGKPLYLEVHKAPFFDNKGRLLGTVGSGRDITNEIKIKRDLQLKEEFEIIFKSSKDGIAIFDLTSKFLEFNDAYLNMTGFTREELLAKSCIELTIPEDIEKSKEVMANVLKNGFVENFEKLLATFYVSNKGGIKLTKIKRNRNKKQNKIINKF
jgi:PAS domain S-box-containing protein